MKRLQKGNLVYYVSPRLESMGVVHGFFTRLGGVSAEPFDSLNVGAHVGDDGSNVEQNRSIIFRTLKLDKAKLVFANKLGHGTEWLFDADAGSYDGFDVVVSTEDHVPVGLSVADCVPIIIGHRNPDFAAVIHAGWRGTVQEVTYKTVEMLIRRFSVQPADIAAAIGPAIGVDSYEVGEEVVQQASKLHGSDKFIKHIGSANHLDLVQANLAQLHSAGVNHVDVLDVDTKTSREFYSYRASNGTTGRNGVFASLK